MLERRIPCLCRPLEIAGKVMRRAEAVQRRRVVFRPAHEHVEEVRGLPESAGLEQKISHCLEARPIADVRIDGSTQARLGLVVPPQRDQRLRDADMGIRRSRVQFERRFVGLERILVPSRRQVQSAESEVHFAVVLVVLERRAAGVLDNVETRCVTSQRVALEVNLAHRRMCIGETRVECEGLAKNGLGLAEAGFVGRLTQVIQPAEIQVIGRYVGRAQVLQPLPGRHRQYDVQRTSDLPGDVLLDCDDVGQVAFVIFRPELSAFVAVDQPRRDADRFAELADAAEQHGLCAETPGDRCSVELCTLELPAGRHVDNVELVQPDDETADLFGESVAEVIRVVACAAARERQYGNRPFRRFPVVSGYVVKQHADRQRDDRNDDDERREGKPRRPRSRLLVPDDALERYLVGPGEYQRDRKADNRQYDQHGHGLLGYRQPVERNVGDLQQYPGADGVGDQRSKYASLAKFVENFGQTSAHHRRCPRIVPCPGSVSFVVDYRTEIHARWPASASSIMPDPGSGFTTFDRPEKSFETERSDGH